MELNITRFFNEAAPMDYSASVAEIGNNAGRYTWRAACDDAPDYSDLLNTEYKRQAFRDYVKEFGAWHDEEIATWNDTELTALLIQFISGDIREAGIGPESDADEWIEYQERSENGQISGRIFKGNDNNVYYYIGN